MNDTTRVTVPPQALEAIAFNLCSLHDFDVAFVRENERFATAVITEYARALSAAPAPEGGAVEKRMIDAGVSALSARYPILKTPIDRDDIEAVLSAALATRLAGSWEAERDADTLMRWANGDLLMTKETIAEIIKRAVPALRAQPPALPSISLDGPNLPDEHRVWLARRLLDSKLTDEEAYGIVRHSPAVKPPAREDALRVAVEALERAKRDLHRWRLAIPTEHMSDDSQSFFEDDVASINKALAALQAEQGAK